MTQPENETRIHSPDELRKMIVGMKAASHTFYAFAQKIGNHAFIEFTGMMNEYIKLCEQAVAQGKDFTCANTHLGQELPFAEHNLAYMLEKLDCIYGPSIGGLLKARLTGTRPTGGSMYERAQLRPKNYAHLPPQRQWEIDKDLGILDWDGTDDRKPSGPLSYPITKGG